MKLIPSTPHGTNSNAEKKIFDLLVDVDLPAPWVAFHSMNVSEHEYKSWSEIDFVLLGPRGLFALEVKGGRVSRKDGIWSFINRNGKVTQKSEGPFDQARTALFGLAARINKKFGDSWRAHLPIGWGVIFPDISFSVEGPDMPREIVCDQSTISKPKGFENYLLKMIRYWEDKDQKKTDANYRTTLISEIHAYLRRDFDVAPLLGGQISDIGKEIVRLTEDQLTTLDLLDDNERICCSGGAGTGKTFMALESARREAANGQSVLIVVEGEEFAAYLKKQVASAKAEIKTISALKESSSSFNLSKYDVLIIDEGQDLLSIENLDLLDQSLVGGIEHGRWRWFMDQNAQAGIAGHFDEEAYELLQGTDCTFVNLKTNCRNTKQIVEEVEEATGSYLGITKIKGNGPRVEYKKIFDANDEAWKLQERLYELAELGVDISDIVILSPVDFSRSSASLLDKKWLSAIKINSSKEIAKGNRAGLLFSSISQFKGLESKYVFVVDTDAILETEVPKAYLYVAMTRANAGLWVGLGKKFMPRFIQWQKEGRQKS